MNEKNNMHEWRWKKENDKRKKEKLMNEWKKNEWMKERETIDKWRVKYVNK